MENITHLEPHRPDPHAIAMKAARKILEKGGDQYHARRAGIDALRMELRGSVRLAGDISPGWNEESREKISKIESLIAQMSDPVEAACMIENGDDVVVEAVNTQEEEILEP